MKKKVENSWLLSLRVQLMRDFVDVYIPKLWIKKNLLNFIKPTDE